MRLLDAVLRRKRFLLAPLFAVACLSGCGKAPLVGKGTLHVVLTASADCNSCGKASGYPLTYRVIQVTDPGAIHGATLTQLWDKEDKLFGPALLKFGPKDALAKQDGIVNPGQSTELPIERAKGATAMIVIGDFCKTQGTCWYYVQPLSQGGNVKLLAGASCLSLAKR